MVTDSGVVRMCQVCSLPPEVRAEIKQMHLAGKSLRTIVAEVSGTGNHISRDPLHRHIREHLAPHEAEAPDVTDDQVGLLVAVVVADHLRHRYNGLADAIALDLHSVGAKTAATIVQSAAVESMRTALGSIPAGSPEGALLEANVLARACSSVLRRPGHQQAARELSDECRSRGADDLANAFDHLSNPVGEGPSQPMAIPDGPHLPTTPTIEESA